VRSVVAWREDGTEGSNVGWDSVFDSCMIDIELKSQLAMTAKLNVQGGGDVSLLMAE
jgi:hypothetical protein